MATTTPLLLRYGRQSIPVASIEEASRLYSEAREASGKGASRWPDGRIVRPGEDDLRISYNGNVWAPGEWQPGVQPIYRPGRAA